MISKTGKSGFTLLELMVATAIAVFIVVASVRIVNSMLRHAEHTMGSMNRSVEIQIKMDQLKADLQSLVWRDGHYGFLRLRQPSQGWGMEGWESVPGDLKPETERIWVDPAPQDGLCDERWGKFGATVELMTRGPRKGVHEPGGVYAVAYQIKRISVGANSAPRYALMRSEVSAHHTYQNGYRFSGAAYEGGSRDSEAIWTPSVIRHPNGNHVFLRGVIDFGIRAWGSDEKGRDWRLLFPNDSEITELTQKPDRLELFLRVLSGHGAQQIENLEQGRVSGDWWETAERHSKVYTVTVRMP